MNLTVVTQPLPQKKGPYNAWLPQKGNIDTPTNSHSSSSTPCSNASSESTITQIESTSAVGIGGVSVLLDLPGIINRAKLAFETKSIEGRLLSIQEIVGIPIKLIIAVASAYQTVAPILPVVATIGLATIFSWLLLASTATYIVLELIKTAFTIVKTVRFEKKYELQKIINEHSNSLNTNLKIFQSIILDDQISEERLSKKETKIAKTKTIYEKFDEIDTLNKDKGFKEQLINTVGEAAAARILNVSKNLSQYDISTAKDMTDEQLDLFITKGQAFLNFVKKALNTQTRQNAKDLAEKIIELKNHTVDKKQTSYLARRIGKNAANIFIDLTKSTSGYLTTSFENLDQNQIEQFNTKALNLLTLVNNHRKKALFVHIFSIFVLTLANVALIFAAKLVVTSLPVALTVSGLSSSASMLRFILNNSFVDNLQKGIDIRLGIPEELVPKSGERTWSILRSIESKNTLGLYLYGLGCVLSAGILPIIDGCVLKAQWIKKLRGTGDRLSHPKSIYSREQLDFQSDVNGGTGELEEHEDEF